MTAAGMAATDVFLAATAALLLVLAVSAPNRPLRLPIQADLLAMCDAFSVPPVLVLRGAQPPEDGAAWPEIELKSPSDLVDAPAQLGLDARLQYAVALIPDADGVLPMTCVVFLRNDLIRTHNASLSQPDGRGPVYTLSVVANPEPQS